MDVNERFSDWYRSVALTPPEGLLNKRWAGIQDVVKQANAKLVLNLARLFTLPHTTESSVPSGFREAFKKHDDAFPFKNNLQEIRVLAGAILRLIIEQQQRLSPLAALALVSGSFGPREAVSPEREHLEAAQRFLVDYSRTSRESVQPAPLKIPAFTKEKFVEKLPPNYFQYQQLPNLHGPLVDALTDITTSFSSAVKQANLAIEQLTRNARVREEEVATLWWLQARFSKDLQKPFSEVGYSSGTLVFPMELADLTKFVPGPESTVAVLVRALQLAGAPSSSEEITIANATNATPREWREKVRAKIEFDSSGLLSPVLIAIHKSLETEGRDEWLPVYRKASDIPIDKPFSLIQLSLQLFHERMLLRAFAEASQ